MSDPMDSLNLIPEDYPCYFIKNVVDLLIVRKQTGNFVESLINLLILENYCSDSF